MFYVRIKRDALLLFPNSEKYRGKVFKVDIDDASAVVTTHTEKDYPVRPFNVFGVEIVPKSEYDKCWKELEKMIEIKGKKYSESIILEALKQYVNN